MISSQSLPYSLQNMSHNSALGNVQGLLSSMTAGMTAGLNSPLKAEVGDLAASNFIYLEHEVYQCHGVAMVTVAWYHGNVNRLL